MKLELLGCITKVVIAINIPKIPNILPLLELSGDDNPFNAKINRTEEIK